MDFDGAKFDENRLFPGEEHAPFSHKTRTRFMRSPPVTLNGVKDLNVEIVRPPAGSE